MTQANGKVQVNDAALKALTEQALRDIAGGAIEYLRKAGKLELAKADEYRGLCAAMSEVSKPAIMKAFNDAEQAFGVGMERIGAASFGASMVLAGIEAAKQWLATIGR